MTQCKTFEKGVQCPAAAAVEIFWPGQTTQACGPHAERIAGVARAMGFALDARPIVAPAAPAPSPEVGNAQPE